MDVVALKLLLAPALVVVASVCARRFGVFVGGLVGGLPVVAAPILLVLALTHGRGFAADAAGASLFGLVALTGFVLAYGYLCRTRSWPVVLASGWAVFLAFAAALAEVATSTALGVALAVASFALALAVLPAPSGPADRGALPAWDLPLRAAAAAAMVLGLTAASGSLGPELSGLLAPFPVVASVLAAFGQAHGGPAATLILVRGMLLGFFAFASFCATTAVALPAMTTGAAFALACGVALALQAAIVGVSLRGNLVAKLQL